MWKVILGVLMAKAIIAPAPIPTRVITVKKFKELKISASAPSGSQIFDDEKEVLASITTFNDFPRLESLRMTTISPANKFK